MSKVERKEYHEHKVMRTMSPGRYGGSSQNVTEFDNNLDNLLDDLQSTVHRPGSSLTNGSSNTYKETSRSYNTLDSGRSNSLNRVTHLKAANPVKEYSTDDSYSYTDPDGTKHFKTVKKEAYSYKSSSQDVPPEKIRMQNNINQLDSLLDDLQQVKQSGAFNNAGVEPGYQYSKSNIVSGKKIVERDVPYGDRYMDRSNREGSVSREIYQQSSEGQYGDIKSVRTTTPSPTRSNNSTLSKQTKVTNVHSYPMEVVQTTTPDINPEILASLDPELLPSGSTKVTTTIKTYTYEIPGAGGPVDTEKYVYSPNQSVTTPSKSFVYNKYENNKYENNSMSSRNYQPEPTYKTNIYKESSTTNNVSSSGYRPNSPGYQPVSPGYRPVSPGYRPSSPGWKPISPNTDRKVMKETVTTRNYQPVKVYPEPTGKQTYVYNESTTTRNYNDQYQNGHVPRSPSRNTEHYVIRESHHNTNTTTNRSDSPDDSHLPPVNSTIHKFDSMTNLNARQYPETESFDPKHPPYPQHGSPQPQNPDVNLTYKYTSHTQTTNKYGNGYPDRPDEPLLPRRFPTDETEGPPKKLDDLMANIGREPPNSPYNSGWSAHETDLAQQRKIDSMKSQQEFEQQKKDEKKEVPRTKNVTGPAVYYPPGHEMFARKEEGGAWRAEGEMAKEKGKYKYEAESKSKTKSSSGAAIVPVCLPLCCGLPCTII